MRSRGRHALLFAWNCLSRGDRLRFCVGVGGAAAALFIELLHIALLRAIEHKAAQVYSLFDADIAIISDRYQFLVEMSDFPAARLRQASAHPGVSDVAAVRVNTTRWSDAERGAESSLLLIGIDRDPAFIADPEVRAALPALRGPRQVLLDRTAEAVGGQRVEAIGETGWIGSRPAAIAGHYSLGMPMYAAATAIVSNTDFAYFRGGDPQRIQLGLIRVKPGVDAGATAAALERELPDDVRVVTHATLSAQEASYFTQVKPLGIIMRIGIVIGLVVGAVALLQVMSAQMEARMHDFAVLRAMGFGARFTYAIALSQIAVIAAAAFVIAWLVALGAFAFIARATTLVVPLDLTLLGLAAMLCAPMIVLSALPLLRIGRADPASAF